MKWMCIGMKQKVRDFNLYVAEVGELIEIKNIL
jgi:hypothetical protein